MTAFDPSNVATWPVLLTVEQMAAIWSQSVPTINRKCAKGLFIPAPALEHPRRWRRSDVLRHVEPVRKVS